MNSCEAESMECQTFLESKVLLLLVRVVRRLESNKTVNDSEMNVLVHCTDFVQICTHTFS